jgi:hypothetical protein
MRIPGLTPPTFPGNHTTRRHFRVDSRMRHGCGLLTQAYIRCPIVVLSEANYNPWLEGSPNAFAFMGSERKGKCGGDFEVTHGENVES